ncbi:DUF948 domain-containing protein [bacterium]|nr:DUF948 domain-containing protein [bacterium]
METEITQMYQSLTFLIWTSVVLLIILSAFLGKFLFDLAKLTRTINETTTIVKDELTPTLKNINQSVETVNKLIKETDEQLNKFRNLSDKLSEIGVSALSKTFDLTKYISKGIKCGLELLFKSFFKNK